MPPLRVRVGLPAEVYGGSRTARMVESAEAAAAVRAVGMIRLSLSYWTRRVGQSLEVVPLDRRLRRGAVFAKWVDPEDELPPRHRSLRAEAIPPDGLQSENSTPA